MAFGNNLYVCQNAFNSEQYFVVGKHYEEFCNYWQSGGEGYVKYEIEHPHFVYIRAADIEGIGLSEQEVQSASLFGETVQEKHKRHFKQLQHRYRRLKISSTLVSRL